MPELIQVKASIPRDLKRRAFAVLALREEKFNHWLARQLDALLQTHDPLAALADPPAAATDPAPAGTARTGTQTARKKMARKKMGREKMA